MKKSDDAFTATFIDAGGWQECNKRIPIKSDDAFVATFIDAGGWHTEVQKPQFLILTHI